MGYTQKHDAKISSLTLSITKHNKNDPLIIEMVLGFSVL